MTEEDQKQIAQITLLNSSMIINLSGFLTVLAEQMAPMMPDQERAQVLLSELSKLQDFLIDIRPTLEQAKKDVGLE